MPTKLEVADEQKLLDISKVISWLDDKRWHLPENYNYINYFRNDLTNTEKILTHWICYITDRQMPFEVVWDKGGFVFSELVFNFSRTHLPAKDLLGQFYEKYSDKKSIARFRFKSLTMQNNKPIYFASRYVTKDVDSIKQTLEILEKEYDKNIINLVLSIMERFQGKGDLLIRVACALSLLTYKANKNVHNTLEILKDGRKFEAELASFKRTSTHNKKRMWCCVRDYKKGAFSTIFTEAIKETVHSNKSQEVINIWNRLPIEQIELPGDVWNNNPTFKDKLFENIINLDKLPKTWRMPQMIRTIYGQMKEQIKDNGIDFYPEQFDITFDFVPRMCNKGLCSVCPFGKNGSELICIPDSEKLCPVALVSCGYTIKCIGREDCIIHSNIGKGVCSTLDVTSTL